MLKKFKIVVSIDGGGIRGIISLIILNEIKRIIQKNGLGRHISEAIDFIAGTSTGAIISAGLIVKKEDQNIYTIDNLLDLYVHAGPRLFSIPTTTNGGLNGLNKLLNSKFHGLKLGELQKEFAFVSFDTKKQLPYVFTNTAKFSDILISASLEACSAVPGYFPPVKMGSHQLIDGAAAAKNPSRIAYDLIKLKYPNHQLIFLSVGTGDLTVSILDFIETGVIETERYMLNKAETDPLLHYFRFQPELLNADTKMDAASPENINALIDDVNLYIATDSPKFQRLDELLSKLGRES